MIVVYQSRFENQIHSLIDILYFEGFFGFEDYAVDYAEKIYDFIESRLAAPTARKCPVKFLRYGEKYLKYKANSHTAWYIFFDRKGDRFIINYILNNHSKEYPDLFEL